MKTSQNGINLIKSFEGCYLTAYLCSSNVPTIGYGHTLGVKLGQKITQNQAKNFLKEDLKVYETHVNSLGLKLYQNQFDALVSFCYNCGFSNLKTLTHNRTLNQIADSLLLYNKGGGKVLQGLKRRREAEKALFLKDSNTLPYDVKTTSDLNIREDAGISFNIIGLAKAGSILKVWAVKTVGTAKWGKNERGYFNLAYTKRI